MGLVESCGSLGAPAATLTFLDGGFHEAPLGRERWSVPGT
jgi:hypothetical protein